MRLIGLLVRLASTPLVVGSVIPSEVIARSAAELIPPFSNEAPETIYSVRTDQRSTVPLTGIIARGPQSCTSAATVAVTFNELVQTAWGESVVLVGSTAQLGSWNPSNGVPLSASGYTSSNPVWSGSITLAAGINIQYKYVKVRADGTFAWEADPNHSYTVPTGCSTTATKQDTWQPVNPSSSATSIATATTSSKSSTSTTSAPTTCTNGPTSRGCWSNGFNIDTDFDTAWPNTGKTVSYSFSITNTTMAPDGYSRMVLAINGQYPGPTIYANWGDWIQVTVKNNLKDNGTSIHWHGMRQYHTNTQDGVPGVSECPLAPGQTKAYLFQATQYGTSWYHSHYSFQYGDGILGSIVINGPSTANYDLDLGPLPVTDWYYPTVGLHAARAQHQIALAPEADTGLINGTMTSQFGGAYSKTTLNAGRSHRVRLINMAVDNHFMVSLDGHQLTVIAADLVPIVPYNTTWLFIGIGQRYDVIINANQAPGSYWFRAEAQDTAGCGSNYNNGNIMAIFAYDGHQSETPISSKTGYSQRCTDETQLVPHWNSYVPPATTPTFNDLNVAINDSTQADGSINVYWQVNDTPLVVNWSMPTLQYVRTGSSNYPATANVITLPNEQTWVYWVITQGAGTPYNVQVPHPIHLHGHDFYLLGAGSSAWSDANAKNLNYNNPTRRDVAMLPSNGWLALAFQTDNPGAWIMHCHIAWHSDEGFAVQFLESASTIQSVSPVGADFDKQCDAFKAFYPKNSAYLQGDSGI